MAISGAASAHSYYVVGVVMPVLAVTAVGLRLWAKRLSTRVLNADDWLILFATLVCVALGIVLLVGSADGYITQRIPLGHAKTFYVNYTNPKLVVGQKIDWASEILQTLSFGAVKLSVVLFYRRVFRGTYFNVWTWFLITLISVWTIAFTGATVFRAGTDFKANWAIATALLTHSAAIKQLGPLIFFVLDVFTDILIICTPLPLIWNLQMSTGRKLGVTGMFFWGALAVVSGLLRLASWVQRTHGNAFSNADKSAIVTQITFWSLFELGIDIVAASLPSLGPILQLKNLPSGLRSLRSRFASSGRRASDMEEKKPVAYPRSESSAASSSRKASQPCSQSSSSNLGANKDGSLDISPPLTHSDDLEAALWSVPPLRGRDGLEKEVPTQWF